MTVGWKAGGVAGATTVQSWRAADPTFPAASTARASKTCVPGANPEYAGAHAAQSPASTRHWSRRARFGFDAERGVASGHRGA